MKNSFIYCLFLILTIVSFKLQAQEILKLEEAISIALENNYDIKLVSNTLAIDKNNISLGNAGMLPGLDASVTNNNSIQNSRQVRENGIIQERNGAKNSSFNYGVGLGWTIFDGFGMFARYEQLQELEKLSKENLEFTILTRLTDVMNLYYDLVQQQQQLSAYDTAVVISAYRLNTAKNRFSIGKAAKLEVLNAQVDLNTDTTNLIRQIENYNNTQTRLNEILGRNVNIRFSVSDSIIIDDKLILSELYTKALEQNPTLKAAFINKRVAELNLKQVRANRYPTVNLNSGYNFNQSQTPLGFTTQSSNRGFNYGGTASINIFNGFNQRRNEKNASLLIENSEIELQRLNQNISAQLTMAYQSYKTNLALVQLEDDNKRIAKKNMEITFEKFKIGTVTPFEIREAQLNFINANVRFSQAQFDAKLSEVILKQLAGSLKL